MTEFLIRMPLVGDRRQYRTDWHHQDRPPGQSLGILKIDLEGDEWTAEVGQPWRNERAGLKDGDLAESVEIRLIGESVDDLSERLVKVERLFLGKCEYILYLGHD